MSGLGSTLRWTKPGEGTRGHQPLPDHTGHLGAALSTPAGAGRSGENTRAAALRWKGLKPTGSLRGLRLRPPGSQSWCPHMRTHLPRFSLSMHSCTGQALNRPTTEDSPPSPYKGGSQGGPAWALWGTSSPPVRVSTPDMCRFPPPASSSSFQVSSTALTGVGSSLPSTPSWEANTQKEGPRTDEKLVPGHRPPRPPVSPLFSGYLLGSYSKCCRASHEQGCRGQRCLFASSSCPAQVRDN